MFDVATIALGIIEGITEFLPVSSTGHLLIAEHWLGGRSDTFNIVIQAGAIVAVTGLYWPHIFGMLTRWRDPETRDYAAKVLASFLITGVLGFAAKQAGVKLPESVTPVAWALVIGGVWMLAAEWLAGSQKGTRVTWTVALVVGLAQVVAGIFPGTSRSAATIFAAMLAGTSDREAATEFAFLVGIPTMYAASAFELLHSLKDQSAHEDWGALAIAFVVSAVTAFVAVRWLLTYIRTHRFTWFAVYRIVLGGFLLLGLTWGAAAEKQCCK
jgi:undecaprenyl-diphosphatase